MLLVPTIIRPKCGITSPTQPMVPARQTELAVKKVAQTTVKVRTSTTFVPRVWASRSPKDITSIHQDRPKRQAPESTMAGSTEKSPPDPHRRNCPSANR